MSHGDDAPYIVIERENGGGAGPFILGALVGAGLALLLAPRSGAETQEQLKTRARELQGAAEERMRIAQEGLEERLDQARDQVRDRVDSVKDAVDAGRRAALDARAELEDKIATSKAAYRAGVDAARDTVQGEAEEAPEDS